MADKKLILRFTNHPGYNLRMATNSAMSQLTGILAESGLRIVEATILIVVYDNRGCRQSQIGKVLNISSANMTPLITRLEERGIIRREAADGRSNALHLTDQGEKIVATAARRMADFEAGLIARVPSHLRKPFLEALRHLSGVSE
ncbi:MAG: MarR family transcriptional regulator [Hyphomonas sp.]|uniref:MarR family winged helix-turn-helix transcriptional regulator n=1 Tax=Hyphomonas sp. TaxID=87 RepID=UPI00184C961F|nr:MarR family transcriptional regulator [Hyphomonas sp.]MBA3066941.1 MarR family transcriptional regulator [Hyphomonas sp.]MBU3921722.1 MarR family transcriptional regulator [Alphaproteobacteria bacterium]MBU4060555.1 MarR family transcriptional regulator [Alphaproteobacteria bacterium]MBU4165823.1 MarR family transcriptional regulator [Alphaproteobacteria bacterium]